MAQLKDLIVNGPTRLISDVSINGDVNTNKLNINDKLILSNVDYGTTLPSTGETGQIFIKLV